MLMRMLVKYRLRVRQRNARSADERSCRHGFGTLAAEGKKRWAMLKTAVYDGGPDGASGVIVLSFDSLKIKSARTSRITQGDIE